MEGFAQMRRQNARVIAAMTAAFAVLALTACVGDTPMPVPTTSSSSTPSPSPSEAAKGAVLRPEGNAAANHQFFDLINSTLHSTNGMSDGRTIVDNLVNNGFLKGDIEVTFDTTALEIPVDSIQVSVRIQGECLIGGFSPAAYTSIKAPVLGTGRCLVGTTRPIDW